MSPDLTPEAWAQIRADYEHTERPIEDICAEHGISSGTLRDRVRRWRWARRRLPIPPEGPPPLPAPPFDAVAASRAAAGHPDEAERNPEGFSEPLSPPDFALLHPGTAHSLPAAAANAPSAPDERPIVERLQSSVDRVLPAIEATVARLGTQGMHPREMERAARALASLTRTLRELNGLLSEREAMEPRQSVEELRASLAKKLEEFVARKQYERAQRGDAPEGGDGPATESMAVSD